MKNLLNWNSKRSITAIEYAQLSYKKLNNNIEFNRVSEVIHSSAVYIITRDNAIMHVGSTKDLNRRSYDHTRVSCSNKISCLNNTKTSKLGKRILGDYKLYYIKESLGLDKDNLSNLEANIGEVFNPLFDTSYRKLDNEKINKKIKILFKNN